MTSIAPSGAPAPEPRYAVERPPEGIARGRVQVAWWAVASLAGLIVAGAIVFLVVWLRRRARAGRYESIAPQSSRR
jgi:hypothetical protein